MVQDIHKSNRIGGLVSLLTLALCILIFVFRLAGFPGIERGLGMAFLILGLPYTYLLWGARVQQRPKLYYIQLAAILLFILIELLLDYILMTDFRNIRWMTILYVMCFFAGTGGLIGIASLAGKRWGTAAIALFLVMTFLAFFQRAKTGM